eukprot:CAMPEP_0172476526 /NCGR_PEP_ID=MMETSP1065-20121228/70422_1 /TAXON_ID=265537 /ORGANISM="Amphiprora paludosa, Strain CCMP125" /LENGTH=563 /DNA_ID=CAMNT_0013234749 /DNA_START=134 /DNA_END=1825 /DNA_ORIENTATION=+
MESWAISPPKQAGQSSSTSQQAEVSDAVNEEHHGKIKRGMKPRSKRNRKRPRSTVLSNDDLKIVSKIVPLSMDNEPVPGALTPLVRLVEPYVYTFLSHAKARWVGRSILDVYASEFGGYPRSYYETAIQHGRILVSDEKVDLTYIIKGNDVLCHRVHRHEPAVAVASDQPPYINIVGETETLLAVDKPATLPVHPCGGYHQNSLMPLLEPIYNKLYTIHRLDRLTSGLTILGKSSKEAQIWGKAIKQRENCEKIYLARVSGHFPANCSVPTFNDGDEIPVYGEWNVRENEESDDIPETQVKAARNRNAYGYWITDADGSLAGDKSLSDLSNMSNEVDGLLDSLKSADEQTNAGNVYWLHFSCPVRVAEPIRGVSMSGLFEDLDNEKYLKTVKPAQTSFSVVGYDKKSDSTIVMCRPETGRTHQIRLHLEHLGHSIANDPNYGGDMFFENPLGKAASEKARIQLGEDGKAGSHDDSSALLVNNESAATVSEVERSTDSEPWDKDKETLSEFIERTCIWCARCNDPLLEYLVRSPGIWLHALQYTIHTNGEKHSFRTSVPEWAKF